MKNQRSSYVFFKAWGTYCSKMKDSKRRLGTSVGEEMTHVTGKQCPQMSCCSCKPRRFFGSRFPCGRPALWQVTLPRTQTHQPNLAPGWRAQGTATKSSSRYPARNFLVWISPAQWPQWCTMSGLFVTAAPLASPNHLPTSTGKENPIPGHCSAALQLRFAIKGMS